MDEVLHICGSAGAGKRYLIEQKIKKKDNATLKRFGIPYVHEIIWGKPDKKDYSQFKEQILSATDSFIIHRWQFNSHNIYKDIQKKFPNAKQRAIWICRNPLDHLTCGLKRDIERGTEMFRFQSVGKIESNWINKIIPLIEEMKNAGISIKVVDGGNNYQELTNYTESHPLSFY